MIIDRIGMGSLMLAALLLAGCGGGGGDPSGAGSGSSPASGSGTPTLSGSPGSSSGSGSSGGSSSGSSSSGGTASGGTSGSGSSSGGSTSSGSGGTSGSGTSATAASISRFTASASATNAGRAVTLQWSTSNADSVTLSPGAVSLGASGSYTVTPGVSTTYTLTASSAGGKATASQSIRIYDWSGIAKAFDQALSASSSSGGVFKGFSFTLFDAQGTLYQYAGGNQTQGSIVPLASASKLPSAAAILTLVDAGKLNLDRPVADYLKGSAVSWPSDKAAITMRMLLNHTSGLPGLSNTQPSCLDYQTGTTLAACTQQIADTALLYTPGTVYNYGGADYQVAGYIATLLSGRNWQTFFANAIGTPLGLSSYSYGSPYYVTNPRIAGGASSAVDDYAKVLQMLRNGGIYNGKIVLSSTAVSTLQINQIPGLPVAFSPLNPRLYPGYSFGLIFSSPSVYAGSPGPEYSDPGSFGSVPWFDNGLGYGAVILTNADTATGLQLWNAVRAQVIAQLGG